MPGERVERTPGVGRRVVWGAADQGMYGLSNTFLAVMVAATVDRQAFGAFSVVLMVYTLTIGTVQGLVSEVFTVTHGTSEERDPRLELAAAAGCSVALGLVAGVLAFGAGALTSGPLSSCLLAFAVVVPVMYVQDTWRFALFAMARPRSAFLNDLAWTIVQVVGVVALVATDHDSASNFILVWGAGALVGAVLGAFQTRTLPRPTMALWWVRRYWSLGGRFAGEFLSLFGAAQLVLAVVAVVGGLTELGRIRAGQVLYSPLQGLVNAVRLAVTAVAVQVWADTPGRLRRFTVILGATLGLAALACTLFAVTLPDQLGERLLGDSWAGVGPVLLPLGLLNASLAAGIGGITALRAMRASRESFRARSVVAAVSLVAGSAGALVDGAVGAAWGLAAGGVLGMVLFTLSASQTMTTRMRKVAAPRAANAAG